MAAFLCASLGLALWPYSHEVGNIVDGTDLASLVHTARQASAIQLLIPPASAYILGDGGGWKGLSIGVLNPKHPMHMPTNQEMAPWMLEARCCKRKKATWCHACSMLRCNLFGRRTCAKYFKRVPVSEKDQTVHHLWFLSFLPRGSCS